MVTVKHPTLKGVSYNIPDEDVERWRKAGWIIPAPLRKKEQPKEEPKTTGDE